SVKERSVARTAVQLLDEPARRLGAVALLHPLLQLIERRDLRLLWGESNPTAPAQAISARFGIRQLQRDFAGVRQLARQAEWLTFRRQISERLVVDGQIVVGWPWRLAMRS